MELQQVRDFLTLSSVVIVANGEINRGLCDFY